MPTSVPHAAPTWPDEPCLAWAANLDPHMWVERFDVLLLPFLTDSVPKARPMGVDVDGILKPGRDAPDEHAQRLHYLGVFGQILDMLAEAGVEHREHPEFRIDGRIDRGPVFLSGVKVRPDKLIAECKVRFRLILESG